MCLLQPAATPISSSYHTLRHHTFVLRRRSRAELHWIGDQKKTAAAGLSVYREREPFQRPGGLPVADLLLSLWLTDRQTAWHKTARRDTTRQDICPTGLTVHSGEADLILDLDCSPLFLPGEPLSSVARLLPRSGQRNVQASANAVSLLLSCIPFTPS